MTPFGDGLSLDHVVDELTSACWAKGAPSRASLLTRLALLIAPGPGSVEPEPGKKSRRGSSGSPAPWNAAAAELLDEIQHGAIDLSARTMAAAGAPAQEGVRGRDGSFPRLGLHALRALRALPAQLELLEQRDPGHPLVRGRPLAGDRGYEWGRVESELRRWHRRARLMVGFDEPPVTLRSIPNPVYGLHLLGPVCESWWECGHASCRRVGYSRLGRYVSVSCPVCGARPLVQDPDTGVLACPRSRCRDVSGARTAWSTSALWEYYAEVLHG